MKTLVTGANGFLGSAVVRRLLARGECGIRCLVRPGSDATRLEGLGVEVIRGTLTRPTDCETICQGVSSVYHLAAGTSGAAADQILNSAVATRNLLDALASVASSAMLVHCSSFGVYGVEGLPKGSLIDENTPLELHPEKRDVYSFAKLRQEQLVWQYLRERSLRATILRPGVVYGPGGGAAVSNRVGLRLFGVFWHLGCDNVIPLTFVDNCAEAMVVAGHSPTTLGQAYNVVDDNLVTAREFLRMYRQVEPMPAVGVPWLVTRAMTSVLERYVEWSKGQLPDVFTQYKVRSTWKGHQFDNSRLKSLGWQQVVDTRDGLQRHFEYLFRRRRGHGEISDRGSG